MYSYKSALHSSAFDIRFRTVQQSCSICIVTGKIQDFILACTYTDYFWKYTQETDFKKP